MSAHRVWGTTLTFLHESGFAIRCQRLRPQLASPRPTRSWTQRQREDGGLLRSRRLLPKPGPGEPQGHHLLRWLASAVGVAVGAGARPRPELRRRQQRHAAVRILVARGPVRPAMARAQRIRGAMRRMSHSHRCKPKRRRQSLLESFIRVCDWPQVQHGLNSGTRFGLGGYDDSRRSVAAGSCARFASGSKRKSRETVQRAPQSQVGPSVGFKFSTER